LWHGDIAHPVSGKFLSLRKYSMAINLPTLSKRVLLVALALPALALARGGSAEMQAHPDAAEAAQFSMRGERAAPPAGVTDLRFREFFRLPIGPRGLEPSAKLLSLDGKRVRLIGYMADREEPASGFFILAPLPVSIAEVEDGPADDMPASVAYVHLAGFADKTLPQLPGLLEFTGTLSVGSFEEADGRVSSVRLQLDATASRALLHLGEQAIAAKR
jgi:hypothetical protein